jgi:hypothetical protein
MICMSSKISKLRAAWVAGDRIGALRIAARFFDRSADTKSFKRGMNAHHYPGFYRQLGKNPDQLVADALETQGVSSCTVSRKTYNQHQGLARCALFLSTCGRIFDQIFPPEYL